HLKYGIHNLKRDALVEKIQFFTAISREEIMRSQLKKFLAAAVAAVPLTVGFGAVTAHAEGEHFVFVSHAPDTDSWWNVIKNALKNAAADTKTTVDYRNPPTGDIADMARIIQQTAAA